MIALKPPAPVDWPQIERPAVFLAGSIEMGTAEDWQTRFTRATGDLAGTALNPRRDDWDSSWTQEYGNLQFREQVTWELEALERADKIAMCFDPATKSPITLLELGLFARTGKLGVFCPEGFWRRGNVEIVCRRYSVPFFESFSELVGWTL